MHLLTSKSNLRNLFLSTKGIYFLAFFMILIFTSCAKDNPVTSPTTPAAKNLVLVTDNDPGSFIMVKIVGEVRTKFPDIHITFLQSKPFDLYEGAFLLNTALQSFPAGTVVAGIIEPGANSKRFVLEAGSRKIFAPNNTLATWVLSNYPAASCYYVEKPAVLGGGDTSKLSFEDFYAKGICSLIAGIPIVEFGSLCKTPAVFQTQPPVASGNSILGQILFTDNFGNCITNIPDSLLSNITVGTVFTLKSGATILNITLGTTYSSVAVGENVCFINSSKLLELAINYGSFMEKFQFNAGTTIEIIR